MQQLEMLDKPDLLRCSICKEVKEACLFGTNRRTKTEKSCYCLECDRAKARTYYKNNRENVDKRIQRYRKSSIKNAVMQQANNAIRNGLITKQPCEECGDEKSEAHHDDYAKPLEVRWLCRTHHRRWHALWGEAPNACTVRHWTPPKERIL